MEYPQTKQLSTDKCCNLKKEVIITAAFLLYICTNYTTK